MEFDPFMMGMGGMPGAFGGNGYMDEEMDEYGEELDEHQELLVRLAACLSMYPGDTFEDTLESVCYVCNVEVESLSEQDVEWLREMAEE